MAEQPVILPKFPQYPPGIRVADAKEQKPLLKLMGKMLKPKMARMMKMSLKPTKKKHQVHFY